MERKHRCENGGPDLVASGRRNKFDHVHGTSPTTYLLSASPLLVAVSIEFKDSSETIRHRSDRKSPRLALSYQFE